jgi:5-methylcytosine-specific restriction endonuclease McrA
MKQKDLIKISQKSNGRCFYCNTQDAEEVDHFFPKKLHADWELENYTDNDDLENLFLSCVPCNRKKRDKHPEDFLGSFKAWSRAYRANYRVGITDLREYSL